MQKYGIYPFHVKTQFGFDERSIIGKILVDEGQAFDFGKTSKEYGKYRDIYPQELFDKLHEIGVGVKGSEWLDLGTGTGVVPSITHFN